MSKKTLNKANLEKLGADTLAALVMELVRGNAALQRRARMELSAAQGPKDVAADLRKRFASLRRALQRSGNRVRHWRTCALDGAQLAECHMADERGHAREGLAAIEDGRALCPDLACRVLPPVMIDATRPPWPGPPVDAIFTANLTHVAPWAATEGLIKGAAARLGQGGLLLIYGPFNERGGFTGPDNAAFDADLRRRNPVWGLRSIEAIGKLALQQGFRL